MMAGALSRKYARSLAEVAIERRVADRVKKDLSAFVELYWQNLELRTVFESPAIPFASKRAIVSQIGSKAGVASEVLNLIVLLLQNNRVRLLSSVQAAFQEALNEKLGIVGGDVYTPQLLSSSQRAEIESKLAALTGKTVELAYHQDTALIGGVKIHLGSTIYDASVSKQLEEIQKRIY